MNRVLLKNVSDLSLTKRDEICCSGRQIIFSLFCTFRGSCFAILLQHSSHCLPNEHEFAESKYSEKIPELEKSLTLVKTLSEKKQAAEDGEGDATGVVRYSLADSIYANADLDYTTGTVYLWLGANVMLEFTYEEALEFLGKQHDKAVQESKDTQDDMATVRDQIVTCEVSISRIFNWSVRKKRAAEGKGR